MIRKNYMVTDKHDALIKKEAKADGVSMSEILRRALDRYFQTKKGE